MIFFIKVLCSDPKYNNVETFSSKFMAYIRFKQLEKYILEKISMIEEVSLIDENGEIVAFCGR